MRPPATAGGSKSSSRQQQKLLHLVYENKIDDEVVGAEQERIERERAEARKWATTAARDGREVMETLNEALALLTDTRVATRTRRRTPAA